MSRLSRWLCAVCTNIALTMSTLAGIVPAAHAGDRTVIWETREGYVAVVPQDTALNGSVSSNNHPVELTDDLLFGLLGSIQVRDTPKDKPAPLFTDGAMQLLAPNLRQALMKAGPKEDVTFVIVGNCEAVPPARPLRCRSSQRRFRPHDLTEWRLPTATPPPRSPA